MQNASAFHQPPEPPRTLGGERTRPLRVFMFKGEGTRQYVLSSDPTGRNIPPGASGAGAWAFVRLVDLVVGEIRPGFDTDEAARAIREDGYALIGCPFSTE